MSSMLLSRILNTAAAFLLLAVTATTALGQGADAEIRALLEARDANIKSLLGPAGTDVPEAKKNELRDVVNGFLDFGAMGEAALGPHWADLTSEQRTQFVEVFSDIVRGQSLANLDPYRAAVKYEAISVDGSSAEVKTSTVIDNVPMVIAYNLRKEGDTWLATDIIIDDVSTVDGYSRSFRTMIRKRGFDTLMERLESRRASMATD